MPMHILKLPLACQSVIGNVPDTVYGEFYGRYKFYSGRRICLLVRNCYVPLKLKIPIKNCFAEPNNPSFNSDFALNYNCIKFMFALKQLVIEPFASFFSSYKAR